MLNRRSFIKLIAAAGGLLLPPISWLAQKTARANDVGSDHQVFLPMVSKGGEPVGELYGGFILLPEGADLPEFVTPPKRLAPDVCGVDCDKLEAKAILSFANSAEQLAHDSGIRLYAPKTLSEFQWNKAYSVNHQSGDISSIFLTCEMYSQEIGCEQNVFSLKAQKDFPHPIPLFYTEPVEPNTPCVVLEKIYIFPSIPAIRTVTSCEYVYYWTEEKVFYTLVINQDALGLVTSLTKHDEQNTDISLEHAASEIIDDLGPIQ